MKISILYFIPLILGIAGMIIFFRMYTKDEEKVEGPDQFKMSLFLNFLRENPGIVNSGKSNIQIIKEYEDGI